MNTHACSSVNRAVPTIAVSQTIERDIYGHHDICSGQGFGEARNVYGGIQVLLHQGAMGAARMTKDDTVVQD